VVLRKLQLSDRGDYGCSKFQFCPLHKFPKRGITNPKCILVEQFRRKKIDRLKYREGGIASPLLAPLSGRLIKRLINGKQWRNEANNNEDEDNDD